MDTIREVIAIIDELNQYLVVDGKASSAIESYTRYDTKSGLGKGEKTRQGTEEDW